MDLIEMVTYTGKENINDENLNLNVNVDTNDSRLTVTGQALTDESQQ